MDDNNGTFEDDKEVVAAVIIPSDFNIQYACNITGWLHQTRLLYLSLHVRNYNYIFSVISEYSP